MFPRPTPLVAGLLIAEAWAVDRHSWMWTTPLGCLSPASAGSKTVGSLASERRRARISPVCTSRTGSDSYESWTDCSAASWSTIDAARFCFSMIATAQSGCTLSRRALSRISPVKQRPCSESCQSSEFGTKRASPNSLSTDLRNVDERCSRACAFCPERLFGCSSRELPARAYSSNPRNGRACRRSA